MIFQKYISLARVPIIIEDGDLRLRPLRISDAAFLRRGFNDEETLAASGLSSPVSASGTAIRRWIKKTYDLAWCLEVNSLPVGFAGIHSLRPGLSAEASLAVFDKAFRRCGYGFRAFRMIGGTLVVRAGLKKIFVRVRKGNQAALSFWGELGFKSVGCEDGACILELDLSDHRTLKTRIR